MATFEQQYEELFGEKITYDPLTPKKFGDSAPPTPRLDLTQQPGGVAAPGSFQNQLDSMYSELMKTPRVAPAPEQDQDLEDFGRALGAGVGQTAEMGLGGLEYLSRQARERVGGVPAEMLDDVTGALVGGRRRVQQFDQDLLAGLSPDALDRLQRQVATLDPDKSIWRGGPGETLQSIALQFTQALPATIITLLPAARWFKAGLSPGAIAYLGASEGYLSMGQVANGIATEIEGMTDEELFAGSPVYKQLIQEGNDPETARRKLTAAAQNNAPLLAGLAVGAISATAGRYLEPVFAAEGAPLAKRFIMGAAAEGPFQEAPQSAIEQYVANVAAHAYDPERQPWDDVLESGAQGLLIGGLTGGAFAGVMGQGPRQDTDVPPVAGSPGGPAPPPEPFENVFGPNPDDTLTPPPGRVLNRNIVIEDAPGGVTPEMRAALVEAGQQEMYLPEPGELAARGAQGTLPMGPNNFVTRTANVPALPAGQQDLPLGVSTGPAMPGGPRAEKPVSVDLGMERRARVRPLTGPGRIRAGQRARGGFQPLPAGGQQQQPVDYSPDMTNPTGRYQDPRQQNLIPGQVFDQGPTPDRPSAEPLADIEAQLQEMERPESDRQGVYLSRANVEMLQQRGQLEPLLERGVVLADFDSDGGVLIARDRQAAQDLLELRNQGAANMQEILGLATGAGAGKPQTMGPGVAVQRRDESGNVVQESVVADDAEAAALAQEWETKYPNFEIAVMSPAAAIRRRNIRLRQEGQKSERRKQLEARRRTQADVAQQVRGATSLTPSEGPSELLGTKETARRVAAGATTPSRAAARMIGQGVRENAPNEPSEKHGYPGRKVGGFYPPSSLEFKDQREGVRYANRFSKLVDLDLESELAAKEANEARDEKYKGSVQDKEAQEFRKARSERINVAENRRREAEQRKTPILKELSEIRERAKPTRKAARYVEAAARVAPEAVQKVHEEVRARTPITQEETEVETGIKLLGEHGAPAIEGELSAEQLANLTDAQINALKGDKLDTAFKSAVTWRAGQSKRGQVVVTPFEPGSTEPGEPGEPGEDQPSVSLQSFATKHADEVAAFEEHKRDMGGKKEPKHRRVYGAGYFKRMVDTITAPSLKQRYVRRIRNLIIRLQHGGKTKSKPVTKTAAAMKSRSDIFRRKSKFNTKVLAADVLPQDESAADRIKREAKARRTRDRLDKTLRRGAALLEKLQNAKFTKIANERTEENELTERARFMIHGRAYLRILMQFGAAMQRSKNKGAPIIKEMETLDELLSNTMKMPAEDFARVMGRLLRAESHQQVQELRNFGELKNKLADPETREEANADILSELLADEAANFRYYERWKKNPFYMSIVDALKVKITNSTAVDGYPSYKPTEEEMLRLQWVMNNWRDDPATREDFYKPIRRHFTKVGFRWTPTKRDGSGGELIVPYVGGPNYAKYKYSLPDEALKPLYRTKFGGDLDVFGSRGELRAPIPVKAPKLENVAEQFEGSEQQYKLKGGRVVYKEPVTSFKPALQPTAPRNVTTNNIGRVGKLLQANRVIAKFRAIIEKPKLTVAGMIRTEERLIRAFKELGMWTQTSPKFGTVAFETPKAYRPVGPRLAAKEITKDLARKLLLEQMVPQQILDKWVTYEAAVRKGEKPLKAETEAFLERVTSPGPSLGQFRKVGLAIQSKLSDGEPTRLIELLDIMLEGLPANHVYHGMARRLLETPDIANTPVSWDLDAGLAMDPDNLGITRWVYDGGKKVRYIALNNDAINHARNADPQQIVLHTLLHEAVHIATQGALDRNPALLGAVKQLQTIAKRFMRNEGGVTKDKDMPYGLRDLQDPNEFVAEAFSNIEFQQLLKRIRYDRSSSLWQKFVELVSEVIGKLTGWNAPINAYEAIMSLEHHLFTGEQRTDAKMRSAAKLENVDPMFRPAASAFQTGMEKIGDTFKNMWARAKDPNAPLIAMTMRQIHKEFRRFFGVGKNPFDRFLEGWENRGAENSDLMDQGQRVSRDWTTAQEQTSRTQSIEFSRILTESTLYGVHPDVPSTAPPNKHLTSDEQKERARDLARRFNALDPKWHQLYKRVRKYYQDTLNREIDLLMLNALRGVLTGERGGMTRADFDKKYNEQSIRKLNLTTKEGLEKEFGELDKSMLRTLQEIASIPVTREGPYFPLMRYGDYVVYAERTLEAKKFTESKDAFAYRTKKLAEDPTLDVNVSTLSDNEHVVYVTERDFRTAESRTEAEEEKAEMIKMYGREAVGDVDLKRQFKTDSTIQSGSALASILTTLNGNAKAQAAVKNFWLRSLADRSFRKHQIRRKQRRGVDFDQQHRAFTNYVKQASYYISQLKYGWRMADAFRDMDKFVTDARDSAEITKLRLREVYLELNKRDEMTTDIEEAPAFVRRTTEIGQLYMLFGPSYWIINSTQPYMVSYPWLAGRYGPVAAGAALINAQRLIISPILTAAKDSLGGARALWSKSAAEQAFNVLDQVKATIKKRGGNRADAYIDMLDQLQKQSVINLSWAAEMRDIAEGRNTSKLQKVMDASRIMAHLTEVNNRILTALAGYELRYAEVMSRERVSGRDAHALAHAAGIEIAKQVVAETQMDVSGPNKPRLFTQGGPLGAASPLVFQFMQYTQHLYAMMISNFAAAVNGGTVEKSVARKTLLGLLATHAAAGGIIGVTLQPLKWAIGLALWGLLGDDEPYDLTGAMSGDNFERATRELMAELLGNELGAVASQGLPELAGVRATDRMSLGTVYYLDLNTDTAESTLGSLTRSFGGPWLSMGFNAFRGSQLMAEGEVYRGIETAMPKFGRDIMRAIRFSTQGVVNNAGDTLIQTDGVSPWQIFLQSLGFQPSEISEFYSQQALKKDMEAQGVDNRNALLRRFRNATTVEARNRVLEEAAVHNKSFPAAPITRSSLIRAVRAKAEREASFQQYGASLKGRSVLYSDEGEFYDVE